MANREYKWARHDAQWIKAHPNEPAFYKDYGNPTDVMSQTVIEPINPEEPPRTTGNNSGVYVIICEVTKSAYIGQSTNIETRLRNHKMCIMNKDRSSTTYRRMVKDYNEHGIEAFQFIPYKYCKAHAVNLLTLEDETMLEFIKKGYHLYNAKVSVNVIDNYIFCPPETQQAARRIISALDNKEFVKQLTELLNKMNL